MSSTKDSPPTTQIVADDSQSSPGDTPSLLGQSTEGLRRIPDRIPWVVLLIIIVELGERFTYFGLSGPLQNYIK